MSWLMEVAEDVTQDLELRRKREWAKNRHQQLLDNFQVAGFKITPEVKPDDALSDPLLVEIVNVQPQVKSMQMGMKEQKLNN